MCKSGRSCGVLRSDIAIQAADRKGLPPGDYRWPAIILRTPKGWTGPETVDGVPVEGTFRSHQVPLKAVRENPRHLVQLERWLRGYHPERCSLDVGDTLVADLVDGAHSLAL